MVFIQQCVNHYQQYSHPEPKPPKECMRRSKESPVGQQTENSVLGEVGGLARKEMYNG
jgi:hypothetical protein